MLPERVSTPSDTPSGQLQALLAVFSRSTSVELEKQLLAYSADLFMNIIVNTGQDRKVRMAACSALKAIIKHRDRFTPFRRVIQSQVHDLYIQPCPDPGDPDLQKIQSLLELLLCKIFEMYYSDQQKLSLFESMTEQLFTKTDLKASDRLKRMFKLLYLLVESFHHTSLNNECVIGALVWYVKVLFGAGNTGGHLLTQQGLIVVNAVLGNTYEQEEDRVWMQHFVQMLTSLFELIKYVVDTVEDQHQQGQNIPMAYLRNSQQFRLALTTLLNSDKGNKILTNNHGINQLLYAALNVYQLGYPQPLDVHMLQLCLSTLTTTTRLQLRDGNENIMLVVLALAERCASCQQYNDIFFRFMQIISLKLLQLMISPAAQRSLLNQNTQYFVEIADDFCKKQESQIIKIRAGSLLATLCLLIDGYLTFIASFCIAVLQHLQTMAGVEKHATTEVEQIMQLWQGDFDQLAEVCILIMASLSDQVEKRINTYNQIIKHLQSISVVLSRQHPFPSLSLPDSESLLICRYMQLASFYSYEHCLDVYLPLYHKKVVYAQMLMNCVQTLNRNYNKSNVRMQQYVQRISQNVLLMSLTLTPLLQQSIMTNEHIFIQIKQQILEKLVLWMLEYFNTKNIINSNKVSNLIQHLLNRFGKHSKQNLQRIEAEMCSTESLVRQGDFSRLYYDSQVMMGYLSPLYKSVMKQQGHPAEQCVIEIAAQHVLALATTITEEEASVFYNLGTTIVLHNNGVLNSCFQLFANLLCCGNKTIESYTASKLIPQLMHWLGNCDMRNEDVWELCQLCEIVVWQLGQLYDPNLLNLPLLFNILTITTNETVSFKLINLLLCVVAVDGQQIQYQRQQIIAILQNMSLPAMIPPYDLIPHCLYLTRAVQHFTKPQSQINLVMHLANLILQTHQCHALNKKYQEKVLCSINPQRYTVQINALQKALMLQHPLRKIKVKIHEEFGNMLDRCGLKDYIKNCGNETLQEKVKIVLNYRFIGNSLRQIVKVKTS